LPPPRTVLLGLLVATTLTAPLGGRAQPDVAPLQTEEARIQSLADRASAIGIGTRIVIRFKGGRSGEAVLLDVRPAELVVRPVKGRVTVPPMVPLADCRPRREPGPLRVVAPAHYVSDCRVGA
jgi:hypothetical protein